MDWQKCVCTLAISECKNCYLSSCKAYKYAQKWLRMLLMLATLSTRGKGLFVVLQLIGKNSEGRMIEDDYEINSWGCGIDLNGSCSLNACTCIVFIFIFVKE